MRSHLSPSLMKTPLQGGSPSDSNMFSVLPGVYVGGVTRVQYTQLKHPL